MRRTYKVLRLVGTFTMLARGGLEAKMAVDWVIEAKYIVTMDAAKRVVPDGAVAIQGRNILAVGTASEIASAYQPAHVAKQPNAILIPGLIDTHTHAPMSLLRGIADDKRLEEWLNRFIFPAEAKNVNEDFVRWGTRLGCLEMLQSGITTYADMYYFEEAEAEEAKKAGVRGVLGQSVIGFPAPDYKTWQEAIQGADKFMTRFAQDDLITPAVAPHSIYTTSDEALVAAHDLAVRHGAPLLIHLAETQHEREESIAKRGLSPTQTLEKLGLLNGRLVAAHAIWEDNADLAILKAHGTGVAHCPSSNTKLASGVARVTDMLKVGINVGLGTDGFAGSNDTADLLQEMDLAAKLQKVTQKDPTALDGEQVLEMATIGGARVLGLEKQVGSLEPGKRADLVAISLDRANAHPLYNVYSFLAYAVKAGDVEAVFVNGKQVVADRRVLTLKADEIYAKADAYRRQILASLKQSPPKSQ